MNKVLFVCLLLLSVDQAIAQDKPLTVSPKISPKIDCHGHCFSPEKLLKYWPKRMYGIDSVSNVDDLIEATMAEYDKNNIQIALLSGDSEVLDLWAEKYPDRILRAFSPDFHDREFVKSDHETTAKELAKQIAENRLHAIGELLMPYAELPIDSKFMWPYYRVAEGKIPVFFHTGGGIKGDHGPFAHPKFLENIAKDFPKLTIVACHASDIYVFELIKVMKKFPNVYADNSAVNWVSQFTCTASLLAFKNADLLDRTVFGSDQMIYPGLISKAVQHTERAGLTDEELTLIYWENPKKILNIQHHKPFGK